MREQKFRIWDEQQKCFQYLDLNEPADPHEFYTAMQCKSDWLQYTGLKDADGVEIYAGDVVYLAGYGNYLCEFPFGELYDAGAEGDIGKVIGNIHENKELLEAGDEG